jgi:endo-beta-1,3-glucanase
MLIKKQLSNIKLKLLFGLMTVGLVAGGTLFALPMNKANGTDPTTDSNYELVWQDEFNGTSLDTNSWKYYTGKWGASNVQTCYRDSTENVNVSGGSLNLVGLYKPGGSCNGQNFDFTSGFVQTQGKKYWTYGYFEARIKMPTNKSTWPAFWMSPNTATYGSWPASGEIDVVESKGSDLNYAAADAHWGIAPGNKRHQQGRVNSAIFSDASQWHTYGVKWTEGKLEFYIDGKLFHTINDFSQPNATTHPGPFNIPFYLRFNLAIGGDYIDAPWNDASKSIADFPATMSIDYVRVYQRKQRQPKTVSVPDNNLRSLLNQKLAAQFGTTRTNDQTITDIELENLTNLNLDAAPGTPAGQLISNLTGLEAAKKLTSLSLQNNAISDLRPLAGLNSLTSLNLSNQKIVTSVTVDSFASPLKNQTGATVAIQDSSTLINDTNTAGNLKLVSPVYDGQMHTAQATWTKSVTIGGATANFSGTLTVNATLPRPAGLSSLQAAITAAEAEPEYIKNDNDVKTALAAAKAVVAQANPSQTDIQNATNNLNNAVAAAKQKERDTQAVAETAVAAAENSKRPSDVSAAQAKVNAVQDPDKKAAFQARLQSVTNAINSAKTSLSTLIGQAQGVSTTGMTSATAQALQAQITASQQVLAGNSSVAELQDSRDKLQNAINNLRADKTALQTAIATAEAEPDYIKNSPEVNTALQQAHNIQSNANPSVADVKSATEHLQQAVSEAKQKERDAQNAAEAAVTTAERDKTQAAIDTAKNIVNKVQDPTKKTSFQNRLNAIVVPSPNPNPNPNPTNPTNSATITQPHGGSVIVSTSSNKCYNLASVKAAPAPESYNNRTLRDVVDFTINCTSQTAATGYTTQVTLTLSRRYSDTKNLIVAKIANNTLKEDITSHVTFGTSADGKYTTISYSLTDGGFGDEDGAANGVIVDPVGVYEREAGNNSTTNSKSSGSRTSLANTGNSLPIVLSAAAIISLAGIVLVLLKRR